jgi:hypothetical protein
MWPLSGAAQLLLTTSHGVGIRATAYTATFGTITGFPVVGGTVTVDAHSQIRRSATVEIGDPALWPDDATDALSPLGSELAIEYGIAIPGQGVEWVPVIQGVITDVEHTRPTDSARSAISVRLADRSLKVSQARFDQPVQTVSGATCVAEIRRLITEVLPSATVTDLTGSAMAAAQMEVERERWADGIEKLADALGAEVFCNPVGVFIIRPTPLITAPPVWVVSGGDGGLLVEINEKTTREWTYNRVVASGQRVDGTPPVWAVVSDTDPASPTNVGGAFGVKTRFYASSLLTTTPQATTAAQALLARTIGMQGTITFSTIVNPALDAGDVVLLRDRGQVSAHIIDSVTVPLVPGELQQISTRTLDLPPES